MINISVAHLAREVISQTKKDGKIPSVVGNGTLIIWRDCCNTQQLNAITAQAKLFVK